MGKAVRRAHRIAKNTDPHAEYRAPFRVVHYRLRTSSIDALQVFAPRAFENSELMVKRRA
jgi:hypothetical protein